MAKNRKPTTDCVAVKAKLQRVEQSLDRWQSRLTRSANMVADLLRRQRYYKKLLAQADAQRTPRIAKENDLRHRASDETAAAMQALTGVVEKPDVPMLSAILPPVGDLDIPAQFRRPVVNEADEAAKAAIVAEQEAKRKIKAKASSEKSRAKKRGDLKRMPLTGKAALAAIREAE